jgi:hypothetical protein
MHMALTEYQPGTAFPGKIGRTVADSSPAWPEPNRAKPRAPSIGVSRHHRPEWEHSLFFRTQTPAAHVRSERREAFAHS